MNTTKNAELEIVPGFSPKPDITAVTSDDPDPSPSLSPDPQSDSPDAAVQWPDVTASSNSAPRQTTGAAIKDGIISFS
jgi:hypothetical protein